jgi:ornithine cyclodeaminase
VQIISREIIANIINIKANLGELILSQKKAFIDFSAGHNMSLIPLQMSFQTPPGDCHVKAGFHDVDDIFVIKIATGFYQNKDLGLPSGDGVILVFSKSTGLLQSILCDNGYLTTLRTALAACVASQIAAVNHIGIVGTGELSKMTVELMKLLYPKVGITVWGRSSNYSLDKLLSMSDLIITTTASSEPIIKTIKKNTHIIALGADELSKQELGSNIFNSADKIIVDSKAQALKFGDSYHAMEAGIINSDALEELGILLAQDYKAENKTIITDLTGIAAQDIAIAKWTISSL